jgi:tripeptidyl-peptidase-1
MHCSLFIFFAAALSGVHCIVNSGSYVVHERRQSPRPSKWIKRAKIQPHAILPIRIGLTQTSLEKAHEYLMDVSDPFSPRYGKHWTEEDIIEKFKPSEECVEAVILWLTSSGISRNRISQSNNKGWLAFDATTKESEDLFHAEFHEYEHEASGEVSVACEVYHLPKHVRLHIDYITPGIRLISMTRRVINKRKFGVQPGNTSKLKPLPIYVLSGSVGATPTEPSNRTDPNHPRPQQMATSQRLFQSLDTCSEAVTPACIQALYSIPPGTRAKPANAMGIYEYADAYDQPDLDTFFARYYPIIPKGTHPKLNSINGGVAPVAQVNRGEESLLDFQVAYPLLWPQGTVLYQVGLSATFNNLLDAIDGVS